MSKSIRLVAYERLGKEEIINEIIEFELSYTKKGEVGNGFLRWLSNYVRAMEVNQLCKVEIYLQNEYLNSRLPID